MNIQGLNAAIPTSDQLHGLNPAQRKKSVEDAIEVVLNAIEQERHAPDLWETEFLLLAMAAVLRGQHWLAATNIAKALALAEERSPEAKMETAEPWPMHRMHATLQAVRAAPFQ
ncbi:MULTISPECIES: hypothetical protein [unclassified Variovorax]|jgi:hypothetical protein|uniref:hypothetical protein n=1 Tax=unclassified Variovorax TaxID=663243 RepID=UPI000F7D7A46|nr:MULTISPECIES: hypothetical protein [unclassified Variovorax]RSZ35116.1 hypothetical protein EJO70_24915 [Variovorax sp. 553]RSZ35866.1 hypothetical protein EJO71_25575 [Variovorax sp. 679]